MLVVFFYAESSAGREMLLREDLLDFPDGVLIGDDAGAKLAVSSDGGLRLWRVG